MNPLSRFGRHRSPWTALLLALASAATGAPNVSLELRIAKSQYLVGEPVVAILTLRGAAEVYPMGERELCDPNSYFRFLVDRGQGFTRYLRKRLYPVHYEHVKGRWDVSSQEYVLSYDAAIEDWFLPKPGTVRLVAEYEDPEVGRIRSAPAVFEVKAPEGEEKAVHDAIRSLPGRGPAFFLELDTDQWLYFTSDHEKSLPEKYPRSAYLHGPRVRDLSYRLSHVSSRIHPEDRTSPSPRDRRQRFELMRQRRLEMLPEAEALAQDLRGGQFEPDSLVALASLYFDAGNETQARELYARVVREFPSRQAAYAARQEVGDTEPPALTLSAGPSALWPPNRALVRVAVAVDVRDDIDSNPAVKLESITCDDGCDPAQDIADADFGVDDREFLLRATRRGGGSGRTYTITYSAQDSAGNKTTKEATVKVAHDQGGGGPWRSPRRTHLRLFRVTHPSFTFGVG